MLIDVIEYMPPRGERIERQAECPDEFETLVEGLKARGFGFAYEVLKPGNEVLYIEHGAGDYRILFLTPEHRNASGAARAILSNVTLEDADAWLKSMDDEEAAEGD